jgi:hypothetical protein
MVLAVPAPNSDGALFAVPEPVTVIGLVIESVPVQVHDPAGITTVSPGDAELTELCTSESWHEGAFTVPAFATPETKIPTATASGHSFRDFSIGASHQISYHDSQPAT